MTNAVPEHSFLPTTLLNLTNSIYTVKVDITDSSGQAPKPLYRDNPFYRKSDIANSENV